MQSRQKSRRNQNELNLNLALSNQQSVSVGGTGATVGGAISSGGGIGSYMGGGLGGGSGYEYCFAGNTPVLMADYSEKPIRETVLFQDSVIVPTNRGGLEEGQIIHRTETMYSKWLKITFTDGRVVEVRPTHRYRAAGGEWVAALELERSFHLNDDGLWEACEVIDRVWVEDGELDFYNIGVRHPAKSYVAAGDWVSNAKPSGEFGQGEPET